MLLSIADKHEAPLPYKLTSLAAKLEAAARAVGETQAHEQPPSQETLS